MGDSLTIRTRRAASRRNAATAVVAAGALVAELFAAAPARADIGRFDGYEIRVIRPRFMAKRGRIELGGEGTLIMNQSFIYTFMATGLLDYHFSEMLGLEFTGSYGTSIDKEDKRVLQDTFQINTQILRTTYMAGGGLIWTPIYGKTQLSSGSVVYFDSFLTAQAGMTGIYYNYEQCVTPTSPTGAAPDPNAATDKPAPNTKAYPTLNVGFGQKYYVTQDWGFRWDVRDYVFQYQKADGSCTPDVSQGSDIHNNITLQLGASTFF